MLQKLLNAVNPPVWVVDELQNKIVLLINHVLAQEPQALERVRSQKGKTVRLQWGRFDLCLQATAAGLVDRPVLPGDSFDLVATLTQTALPDVVNTLIKGHKPNVIIEGDVQLAAEVAWLVDNLRWDVREDLARLLGDAPAAALAHGASMAAEGVKAFVVRWRSGAPAAQAYTP